LAEVSDKRAVVILVEHPVVVVVNVAGIAQPVTIGIGLVRVRDRPAVVGSIRNAVVIRVGSRLRTIRCVTFR
jgi:hypothetical protein